LLLLALFFLLDFFDLAILVHSVRKIYRII